MKKKLFIIVPIIVVIIILTIAIINIANQWQKKSQEVLKKYFALIEERKYEEMYDLVNISSDYSKEDFIKRNKNIYEGIDTNSISIEILSTEKDKDNITIIYKTKMVLKSGDLEFENRAKISKNEDKQYKINWSSNLIFPMLDNDCKVRVSTLKSERGSLLDRNSKLIAGQSLIARIGIVPGKLGENKEDNIEKAAKLLNITTESINKTLSASWIKDDSFVSIKNISFDEKELKDSLLNLLYSYFFWLHLLSMHIVGL